MSANIVSTQNNKHKYWLNVLVLKDVYLILNIIREARKCCNYQKKLFGNQKCDELIGMYMNVYLV